MKLYKYMSPELAEKFIKRPLLRITPAFCLNDPFEVSIPQVVLNDMKNEIIYGRESKFENDLNRYMLSHGIISLSATNDNLLMWSHYAKNHEGFVVEILIDQNDEFSIFNTMHVPKSSDASLCKVSYEENRLLPYQFDVNSFNEARNYYYATKFLDWEYEREYRFIYPCISATVLILDTKNLKYNSVVEKLKLNPPEVSAGRYREVNIKMLEIGWADAGNNGNHQFYNALIDVWLDSKENGAIFLVELSSKAIGKVFVGARANVNEFERWFKCEDTLSDVNYYCYITESYVNVMEAKLDLDNFSVEFSPFNVADSVC
ncbi:DUF2971 domain-containing protein [Photobacterium chitinilyticum]|uniref:DUF2971 domain-containing protein n=1 Tax=Photobacterium chitinilyticum TaxID=2485123 RepID=UPI0013E8D75F|nr:DUF2971 domain-containing protein [Photobacterium chitinilyticum]